MDLGKGLKRATKPSAGVPRRPTLMKCVKRLIYAIYFSTIILKRTLTKVCFGLCALVALSLSFIPAANAADDDETGSVLVVGNSFIAGILPHTKPYGFSARWIGGHNLGQHARDATTRARICGNYKYVVLQDSSTRASNNTLFQLDIDAIVPMVNACDAIPVLYMTWETDYISFAPIESAYQEAADKYGLQVIAIGSVWHEIRLASETIYRSLLAEDGGHADFRGHRVIAASMLKAFCESCYRSFNWIGFSPSERTLLKSIISQKIMKITVPMPETEPEEPKPSHLPAIIELLLRSDAIVS